LQINVAFGDRSKDFERRFFPVYTSKQYEWHPLLPPAAKR
jgi:hypothetical protein